MRKNYFYLVLLLLLNTLMFGQKVTLTSTNGPINLGSANTSTISLGVKVDMPAIPGDNGTIKIISVSGSRISTVTGGDGGALFFGEGKTATRSFVVQLYWGDFSTSGGYIYAEYKTSGSIVYKSSYLGVTKNSTMGGGTVVIPPDAPNPSNITNSLCCDQTIRQGEKPAPLTGSQYADPYSNTPYGINAQWTYANGTMLSLDNISKTISLDYATDLKNITVTRALGYNYKNDFPNKSNTVTITVVPSPIILNEISINTSIDTYGFAEIINTNPKEIIGGRSYVNLNILQNPSYIVKRGDPTADIERYEWEFTKTNIAAAGYRNWIKIPNADSANLQSYNLSDINDSEESYFLVHRIAIYGNIRTASNTLKIVIRKVREDNTICCDQILQVSSSNEIEKPSTITGPIAMSNKDLYLFYQWQSQTITDRGNTVSNWTNIPNATSKDYLPPALQFIPGIGRNAPTIPTYNYRRIAKDNGSYGETYYSNEISLTPSTNILYLDMPLTLYPNPATDIIYIKNEQNLFTPENTAITIVNINGLTVNSNNFSLIDSNLITINVSNLIMGTYFINVKTNNISSRNNEQQFKLIKQ